MMLSHSEACADGSYAEHTRGMLKTYGLSEEVITERTRVLADKQKGKTRPSRRAGDDVEEEEKGRVGEAVKHARKNIKGLEGEIKSRFEVGMGKVDAGSGPDLNFVRENPTTAGIDDNTSIKDIGKGLGLNFGERRPPTYLLNGDGGGGDGGKNDLSVKDIGNRLGLQLGGRKPPSYLVNDNDDAEKKETRVKNVGMGLGLKFGGRKPPSYLVNDAYNKATDEGQQPNASTGVERTWQAKAAFEKTRREAASSLFENRSAASLPPGPLSTPRWETAFQVERPDEGSTGGLAFIATLAGAFAIKAVENIAEEYFGTEFHRSAGAPVPNTRVIFPTDAEHASIITAVETVAKQYSRRGDSVRATAIMLHVYVALTRYNGPFLLLDLVPAALSLGAVQKRTATLLLEPQSSARASARLEAIGRVWVIDAALSFRDRFASRLSNAKYDEALAYAEGGESSWGGGATSPEEVKGLLLGNLDNVLLTDAPLDVAEGSSGLVAVGVAAIDSHVKLIRGAGSDDVGDARTKARAQLYSDLGALLLEASDAEKRGTLTSGPSQCLEWLRFTMEAASGHRLSDGALAIARLGALRGIAAVPDAVAWARSELAAVRDGGVGDTNWQAAFARIDEEALFEVGLTFECLQKDHFDLFGKLPPSPDATSGDVNGYGSGVPKVEKEVAEESKLIGAEPRLWAALSSGLREVLLNERVRRVPAGPHSLEWPGWTSE